MARPIITFIASLIGAIILVAAVAVALAVYFEFPGGMTPSYRASDHDRRLTPIAREAAPLIAAIRRFYTAHGRCPQINDDDLVELRGVGGYQAEIRGRYIAFSQTGPSFWLYSLGGTPTACQLWRKLGWDPALIWYRDGEKSGWMFAPGDGSKDIPLVLD